ncbi:MAG: hypothetical protein KIS78_21055 [Labilithrix sp.]|nr:hypothetical protein [Labilithrix sp.]MCW5834903.1 hypothetical protein [Labilithrix sp.]
MRNTKWLRYSLASLTLIAGGLSGLLVACGDDDDNPVTPGNDAGDTDTGTTDAGTTDAPNDQTNPPADAGTNAKLQLVNAATDFGPSNPVGALRVCYGLGPSAIAPLPPLPDRKSSDAQPYPGVYIGTGGAVQGTGADLTTVPIVPYLMNAQSLSDRGVFRTDAGAGPTCADLLGNAVDAGGAFVEGVDYWKLPAIPANTFVKEKSFILVLTGCAGDSTLGAEKCGEGFAPGGDPGNGNLKVTVYEVDRASAVAADKIGTQFIHASPAGAAALAVGGIQVVPGYIANASDPATFKGLSADGGAGPAVAVGGKTDFVQVEGVNVASDSFTANPSAANLAISLANIQLASYGANVPAGGEYRNGAAFTFIALGDPAEPATVGGQFNTKTFHFIALPNDPINEVYKP